MPRLSLRLLGPFQVELDGQEITGFESDKERALLAYLAVEADRPHRRESLAALLWPERPERAARGNLRHVLSHLRGVIGDRDANGRDANGRDADLPLLLATRDTIGVNPESTHWLDVDVFEALTGMEAPSQAQLTEAVALYRGDFLAGFSLLDSPGFDDWALLVRDRLQREMLAALTTLAASHEAAGELDAALAYVRRGIALAPWEELGYREAMRLYALAGDRSAALAQYAACQAALQAELDVAPTEETTRLYEAIRAGTFQPLEAPAWRGAQLPMPLIPLVGREEELAYLTTCLRDPDGPRLLTILGPGGIGKTHLALEAARQVAAAFAHGVCFLSLEGVSSPQGLLRALVRALALRLDDAKVSDQQRTELEAVIGYLRSNEMLLLLDAFEGVIAEASALAQILTGAPGVKALVTSRARLDLAGETVYRLDGLPAGSSEGADVASAEALFTQAARRLQTGYAPDADERQAIADICRFADGSPLAILLAAGWIPMMSASEIAGHLTAEPAQALAWLSRDSKGDDERHRSMRQVFDLSWGLLDARRQGIVAALSCFRGGFTAAAAAAVGEATPQDLMHLLDRSLLHRVGRDRYGQHALLAAYGTERLAEDPAVREGVEDRYVRHYARQAVIWEKELKGPRQFAALDAFSLDLENIMAAERLALARCASQPASLDALEQLYQGLTLYNFCQGPGRFSDERDRCEAIVTALQAALAAGQIPEAAGHRVLARVLAWLSVDLAFDQRPAEAQEAVAGALAAADRATALGEDARWARACALWGLGRAWRPDAGQVSMDALAESRALARDIGDRWLFAEVSLLWAWRHHGPDHAEQLAQVAEILRSEGDTLSLAGLLSLLAVAHATRGQVLQAERTIREARALPKPSRRGAEKLEIPRNMSPNIGHAELLLGQFEKAQDTLTRILAIAREKGFQGDSAWASAYLALTEQYLGHYEQAAQHAREAHALGLHTAYSYAVLSTLAILRDDPCEAIQWAQRATYPGRAVVKPLHAALLYSNLACGAQSTAQLEAARRLHAAILPPPWTVPHRLAIWLPPAAVLLAGLGDPALAVEAYALAQTHPMAANSQFHRNLYGPRIHEAAASLGIEAAEAARARGRSREAEAMIADVMAVLGRATEDADLGTLVEGLLATLDARP